MSKKCIICGEEAKFKIKDTRNECYCQTCAEENFAELNLLQKIEEEANLLKKIIKKKLNENSLLSTKN